MTKAWAPLFLFTAMLAGITSLSAKEESKDNNVETLPVSHEELSPLGSPILWKHIYRQGPIVGVPLPWNLGDSDTVSLCRMRVEGRLRVSEAEVKVVLSLHNSSEKERTVKMAVPVCYESREGYAGNLMEDMWSKGVNTVMDGNREDLIERAKVSAVRVTVDDKEVKYDFKHETHPQKDAPTLKPLEEVKEWIIFPVEFKGNQELLVEVKVILPYSQDITVEKGKEIISPARLKFLLSSARGWRDELTWGTLGLDPQEMNTKLVKIKHPETMKSWKKSEGWYDWPITSETLALTEPLQIDIFPEVRLEKAGGEKIKVNAGTAGSGTSSDQYNATASSILEGTDPNFLKTNGGYWSEGVSGDGQNEWVELAMANPRTLMGFIFVNGKSPAYLGAEEQKHPDLAHSFYGLPKKIQVTVNGSYTFPATVREDWNTQFIFIPYYNKPVKTLKITYDTVRGGKVSADTCISQILPVGK